MLKVKKIEKLQSLNTKESKSKEYKCSFCKKRFIYHRSQLCHEVMRCPLNPASAIRKQPKSFTCKICGANYKSKYSLAHHDKYDCGRKHECSTCGRIYTEISNLKKHWRKSSCVYVRKTIDRNHHPTEQF